MFVDYYALLEIPINASAEEVRKAFKAQALKWHPDRNPGVDTTVRMQAINEAFLILKDPEARQRFDQEYRQFRQRRQGGTPPQAEAAPEMHEYADYEVQDDLLKRWMSNARRQAVDLAKQTVEDLKGMTAAGAKAAVKEAGSRFISMLVLSLVVMTVLGLAKTCN